MMDGIYQSWQNGVMWACLGMLGVMAVGIILYGFGLAWGKVREWWSLPLIERVLAGVFVVGFVYYGSTKSGSPSVRWDDGLADNGTLITNDTVSVRWTYSGIPSASSVFIDYREAGSTNEWLNLAETLASAQEWTGTLANATNYDYWVYSTYVPPVPVHTNGVWVGQAYETKARVGAKSFLILNGKVQEHGRTIATPAAKRKDAVPTARDYIQDGLVAMWDGIENAGWGVHNPNATVWKDLVGDNDITIVGGAFGNDALICNGTQYGGHNDNVVNAVQIELVANTKQQKRRCWIASTGQSLSSKYSGFVGWYDRGLCFGLYDTARSLTLGTAISYSFAVNSNRTFENNALVATESGKSDLTPQAARGICVVVGGQKNNPLVCDIHCFRIYSRALTNEEIRHNYEIDKERFNLP